MHVDVIDPKRTAMIVVDMQNDFVASGAAMETPAARQIVPKIAERWDQNHLHGACAPWVSNEPASTIVE